MTLIEIVGLIITAHANIGREALWIAGALAQKSRSRFCTPERNA